MKLLEERNGIHYALLEKPYREQAIDCTFNQFYNFEPLMKVLRVSPVRFRGFIQRIVDEAITDALSVAAIEPVTGELAGVMLCDDYGRPPIENLDADVIAPVLDLLGQFQQQYQQARPFGPNEVFHTFMASVWPAYQGRGIGRSIFDVSFGVGRARGFRRVVCECTAAPTQTIFLEHFRHRVFARIRYADYEYKGVRVFATVDEPTDCVFTDHPLVE